jgi:predicted SAM-dependent methyltransferase
MPGDRKLVVGDNRTHFGWESCDIRPGGNYVCSATEVSSLGKFDVIHACMVLEHLRPWEIPIALKDWYEALNENGYVDIIVPDLTDIAETLFHSGANPEALRRLFGGSVVENGPDDCQEQEHRWAFDAKSLTKYLTDAGFKHVTLESAIKGNLWMKGYK